MSESIEEKDISESIEEMDECESIEKKDEYWEYWEDGWILRRLMSIEKKDVSTEKQDESECIEKKDEYWEDWWVLRRWMRRNDRRAKKSER